MVFVDKWGHSYLYPSKSTAGLSGTGSGFFYEQSDDIMDDNNFNGEGDVSNSSGGEWTFNTDGATSVQIFKNSDSADSIGGCNMNFAQTLERGYGYKQDDPRDVEIKFLIRFDGGSGAGFAVEGPTGRHSGDGCCQGFAYKIDIDWESNPPVFRFRKEMWHVSNHTDPDTGEFTDSRFNFDLRDHNDFVGFGYVHYVKKDGVRSGVDSVILEFWGNIHPITNPTDWFLIKRTEDTGGWGNDGDQCSGDDDQIGAWSNSNFRLKSNANNGEFRLKHLSLREIDPTKSFDDEPETPPIGGEPGNTTTLQGFFKFQQDINTYRTSSCAGAGVGGGGGGETGNAIFWTIPATHDTVLSNSSAHDNRTRVAEKIKKSSSSWNNKLLEQLDVPLKKVGSPTTPNINAKIWASNGSVIYTSPTNIDPATLTTSFVKKVFDFSANTHVLVVGDIVGVEWINTSDVNYVEVGYENGSVSEASVYVNYESGSWEEKGSRDFACDAWE